MFKSPFRNFQQTDIIAALIVATILGVGVVSNLKNPISTRGLLQFDVKGERAYGNGYTDARSVSYAKSFFNDNPHIKTLVLQNMSGTQDADQNLRIAREIRRRGIETHLESGSRIASGAVDLFLAGTRRTIACGAAIGVHSWSAGELYDAQDSYFDDRRGIHERFLRDMGIDTDFYVFTRDAARADDIHILTDDEIRRFKLTTEPHECSE